MSRTSSETGPLAVLLQNSQTKRQSEKFDNTNVFKSNFDFSFPKYGPILPNARIFCTDYRKHIETDSCQIVWRWIAGI